MAQKESWSSSSHVNKWIVEVVGFLSRCGGFLWRDLLEKLEDLSDFEPDTRVQVHMVLDVTDVLVSHSFVVTEFCDGFSCYSDWKDVVPQSFSFS